MAEFQLQRNKNNIWDWFHSFRFT